MAKCGMFDFSALSKAAQSLAEALAQMTARPGDLLARDGCIQRFECTYELCVKALRRQIESMADSPNEIDGLGFKDMIRLAYERQLLTDPLAWFGYQELRNISAHVYDGQKAEQLYQALPGFAKDATALATLLVGMQGLPS